MLDARTDKTWKRMQEEDAGVSLPRKEGFENIYDEKIPNEVKKFFGKKAWGNPRVGTINLDRMSFSGKNKIGYYDVVEKETGKMVGGGFGTKEEAQKWIDDLPSEYMRERVKVSKVPGTTLWHLPIPPK